MIKLPAFIALALALAALEPSRAADQPSAMAGVRPSAIEIAHAQAVDSFRRARFSEAYGRFIQLADAGHAPAARLALWMCEQGPELFGKDWDCTPDEVADWASLARVPMPQIGPRSYPSTAAGAAVVGKPAAASADRRTKSVAR